MICKHIFCRQHYFKISQSSSVCTLLNGFKYYYSTLMFYLILIICLHTVKWCQVYLYTVKWFQVLPFTVCTHSIGFKYCYLTLIIVFDNDKHK